MKRALVLEDCRTALAFIIGTLRARGFSVESCAGIVGARAACNASGEHKRFDLYVVDGRVRERESGGDGDGAEFVKWLLEWYQDARIIVCSGDAAYREIAEQYGAAFVDKKDFRTELVATVDRVMRQA